MLKTAFILLSIFTVNLSVVAYANPKLDLRGHEPREDKTLVSASTKAMNPDCKTINDCESKGVQVDQGPIFFPVARDPDGKVKYMNIIEAVQHCENNGSHLPSARELAQFSVNLGAKGIVEVCDAGDDYCQKIEAKNIDGKNDSFYFSSAGYRPPEGDLGKVWFLSSLSV